MAKFSQEILDEIKPIAKRLGVRWQALAAIAEVEAAGRAFAKVRGKDEPLIRFEGHYFDRRLVGPAKAKARAKGLAHPKAGRVKNPRGQANRWNMLDTAIAIDRKAALESCSWGLGQVMGSHWDNFGFASVDEFVACARSGVAGQVELMARFIENNNLKGKIQRLDWAGFARKYNGPAYKKNRYDVKMAKAYARYMATTEDTFNQNAHVLRLHSRGVRVKAWQGILIKRGFLDAGDDDGIFGKQTEDATIALQEKLGITADGVVGTQTREAERALSEGDLVVQQKKKKEAVGKQKQAEKKLETVKKKTEEIVTKLDKPAMDSTTILGVLKSMFGKFSGILGTWAISVGTWFQNLDPLVQIAIIILIVAAVVFGLWGAWQSIKERLDYQKMAREVNKELNNV